MFDLFNQAEDDANRLSESNYINVINDVSMVKGLTYIPSYITKEEEEYLIKTINSQPWLNDIKRRVQHYGYKYDYKIRTIDYSMFLGNLPEWGLSIAKRLYQNDHIGSVPDQMIVNEYIPGQGIANHIDCEPCFGNTIISLSLGAYCGMDFIQKETNEKVEVLLEPRSLVVIKDDARYKWTHGIAQRKTDIHNGIKFNRQLRISVTFRKVIVKE